MTTPTTPPVPRRALGSRLAALWFVLSAVALVWPVYPWLGNHVHPRVLGLPWSLVYVLLVITANFAALLLLYRLRVVDDHELPDAELPRLASPEPEPEPEPEPAGPEAPP